jgi:prevent-host-death family protein
MSLPPVRSIGIRAAKASFSSLLDEVEAGAHVLLYRRSKPVAALIPTADLERFRELIRREEELGAVLRARGHAVEPLTTAQLIEVMVSHLGAPRSLRGRRPDGATPEAPSRGGGT